MSPRSGVLNYEATNAVLGWVVIAVLGVVTAIHVYTGEFLWSGLGVVMIAVALVPPALSRRPTEMIAWEVLSLGAFPVVAAVLEVADERISYVAVPALALIIVVELDAFTAVDMTTEFAVAFVVIVTMGLAGLWVVAEYASDVYFGTSLLTTQTAVMWDLIIASTIGVIAGAVFELYFRRISPSHDISREPWGNAR